MGQRGGDGVAKGYLSVWTFCRLKRMWKSWSSSISPADNMSSTRASSLVSRAGGEIKNKKLITKKNQMKQLHMHTVSFATDNDDENAKSLPSMSACSQKMQGSGYRRGPPRPPPPSCPLCSSSHWLCGTPVSSCTWRLLKDTRCQELCFGDLCKLSYQWTTPAFGPQLCHWRKKSCLASLRMGIWWQWGKLANLCQPAANYCKQAGLKPVWATVDRLAAEPRAPQSVTCRM